MTTTRRSGARGAAGTREARPLGLERVRGLAHPLRLSLYELFVRGPRTTMQAAAELGQPPTRLYHHVAELVRVGLLRLRETRPNRGTIEKYYEVVRHPAVGDGPAGDGAVGTKRRARGAKSSSVEGAADQAALGTLVLERVREEFVRVMGGLGESGGHREDADLPVLARVLVSTSAARRARLRVEIRRFLRRVAALGGPGRSREKGPLWSVTLAMLPAIDSGTLPRVEARRKQPRRAKPLRNRRPR